MGHLSAMNGFRNLNMHQWISAVVCKTCPYHPPSPNEQAAYPAGIVAPKRAGECFTTIVESIACVGARVSGRSTLARTATDEYRRRLPSGHHIRYPVRNQKRLSAL